MNLSAYNMNKKGCWESKRGKRREENVNINDLPEEIKRKLKGFNLLKGRLKNEGIRKTILK